MHLDVVLRTCSSSLLDSSSASRICGSDRGLLIRKCFISLVRAIRNSSSMTVRLTVIDDHSDRRFLDFMRDNAAGLDVRFIHMDVRGPNGSAAAQFKAAAECDGLVYVVEDDYLHEENALDAMASAYMYFMKRNNKPTVIYPYDCSLRYVEGREELVRLYHDGRRYWRDVDKTANTMFTHYSTIKMNMDVFMDLAMNYPRLAEDDTINTLYCRHGDENRPIRAYSPIPSVAYHVGYSTPKDILTTHGSWRDLWGRIGEWELIQGWFYHPEFYSAVVDSLPASGRVVEVGAWRGRSTGCLASLVKRSGKAIDIYVVDTWEGSPAEHAHRDIIRSLDTTLYDDFIANMKMCGVDDVIRPLMKTSVEASRMFDDESVDFVMIDGSHDYDSVREDILHWLPKVKRGGIIAGDDYSDSWPGVKRAVDELVSGFQLHDTTWYARV